MTSWTDILGEEMGRMFDQGIYPETSQEFTARTGITPTSIYTFQEESGSVVDKVSGLNLSAGGVPVHGYTIQGRRGVAYTAANAFHSADVHDVGSSSFVAWGVHYVASTASDFIGMFGRNNATSAEQWSVWFRNAALTVEARIRDNAAGSVTITTAATQLTSGLHLVALQVDRAATTARLRVSGRGTPLTASGSIAALGSLSGAAQVYGFGDDTPVFPGAVAFYGGVATGAQCEGASVLQNLSRGLGWE